MLPSENREKIPKKANMAWLAVIVPLIVSTNGIQTWENDGFGTSFQSNSKSISETKKLTRLNKTQGSRKSSDRLLMGITTFAPDQDGVAKTKQDLYSFLTLRKFSALNPQRQPSSRASHSQTSIAANMSTANTFPFSSTPGSEIIPETNPLLLTNTSRAQGFSPAVETLSNQPISNTSETHSPPSSSAQMFSLPSSAGKHLTLNPWNIPLDITPPPTPTPPSTWGPQPSFCPQLMGSLFGDSGCSSKVALVPGNAPERPVWTEYFTPYPRPKRTPMPPPLHRTPAPLPTQRIQNLFSSQFSISVPSTSPSVTSHPLRSMNTLPSKDISKRQFSTIDTSQIVSSNSSRPISPTHHTSFQSLRNLSSRSPITDPILVSKMPPPPRATLNLPSQLWTSPPKMGSSFSQWTPSLKAMKNLTSNTQAPLPTSTKYPLSNTQYPSTNIAINLPTKSGQATIKYKYRVFDDFKNTAREVVCFKHFLYKNGDCQFVNNNANMKITATLGINLHRQHAISNQSFTIFSAWLNLLIINHFSLLKLAEVERIIIFQHENNSMLYRANVVTVVSPKVDLEEYISTLISVLHNRNFSNENMVGATTEQSFDCNFRFESAPGFMKHQRFTKRKETKYVIRRTVVTYSYTFSRTMFCPMLILNTSEVFYNDKYQMCLTHFNVCFDSLDYYQGKSVQVCMDKYFSTLDWNLRKSSKNDFWVYRYTPEGVVSFVLMCLSALCLVVTLIIHFLCPELRTLPGKSNMFLSISLLLAQLTFQFGMTQNDFPLLCKVIGFFIHYFWLLSFSWMSACSIQMFLKFGRFTTATAVNNSEVLFKYCLYAFGSPFLFLSTNIVYSLVSSSGTEYGYGLNLCYISYPLMVFVTFTVPACLVTVKNVLLFIVVCCRIGRHQQLRSVNSHFSRGKVLVKLSFLTGCTWLVGFVNHWVKQDALQYVFVILNASQGIFIMVSFVCTKRVFGMLQKKWK